MLHEDSLNCDGYTALWRAVLLRALQDATFPRERLANTPGQVPPTKTMQLSARDFFTPSRRRFQLVCSFADLDPDYVMRKYREALKEAQ